MYKFNSMILYCILVIITLKIVLCSRINVALDKNNSDHLNNKSTDQQSQQQINNEPYHKMPVEQFTTFATDILDGTPTVDTLALNVNPILEVQRN